MWFDNTTLLLISGVLALTRTFLRLLILMVQQAGKNSATSLYRFKTNYAVHTGYLPQSVVFRCMNIPALFNVPGDRTLLVLPDDKTTTMAVYIMRLYNSDVGSASSRFRSTVYYHVGCQSILFATLSDSEDRRNEKEQKQRRKGQVEDHE